MKKYTLFAAAVFAYALTVGSANANTFVNGGFETGDVSGWAQQGGNWYGGSNYNIGTRGPTNTITSVGADPIVGSALNQVFNGQHSLRVNDWVNDYSVSVVKQTVTNYTDDNIYFAWAAVLESSHGPTDSDHFRLTLTDDNTGNVVVDRQYNSATNGAMFVPSGNWFYTPWQTENINVKGLGALGHDFTLTLLASDCPYSGHAGYVYLDGFSSDIVIEDPGGNGNPVPEPGTFALLGLGLAGLGLARRRMKK